MNAKTQTKGASSLADERPTLLVVGRDSMSDAVLAALNRYRVHVESCGLADVSRAALTAAPDLVLLLGDAAKSGGTDVLRTLAKDAATSVVPVVLLADDASLDERVRAFKSGAVAVIPKTASADEIARRVAELAAELPERPGQAAGQLGEATLDELVELLKHELRTGILSVSRPSDGKEGDEEAVRLVLGAGKPVADALADFVKKLRPLIARAEPLRYEFHEETGGRLQLLDAAKGPAEPIDLSGLRILVMDTDPGRADALAQELRSKKAQVGVTDVTKRGFERARSLDPEVIVIDGAQIDGPGFEIVRDLRRDHRLRWASLLVVSWDEIWSVERGVSDLAVLTGRLAPLVEQDRLLRRRGREEKELDTRLEIIGPGRMLRALAKSDATLHLTVRSPKASVDVDLAQGLLVGATASLASGETIEGPRAVATLLALSAGRVHIEKRDNPTVANIMSPMDEAIAMAALEPSPIAPSVPPTAPSEKPRGAAPLEAPAPDAVKPARVRVPTMLGAAPPPVKAPMDVPTVKPAYTPPKPPPPPAPLGSLRTAAAKAPPPKPAVDTSLSETAPGAPLAPAALEALRRREEEAAALVEPPARAPALTPPPGNVLDELAPELPPGAVVSSGGVPPSAALFGEPLSLSEMPVEALPPSPPPVSPHDTPTVRPPPELELSGDDVETVPPVPTLPTLPTLPHGRGPAALVDEEDATIQTATELSPDDDVRLPTKRGGRLAAVVIVLLLVVVGGGVAAYLVLPSLLGGGTETAGEGEGTETGEGDEGAPEVTAGEAPEGVGEAVAEGEGEGEGETAVAEGEGAEGEGEGEGQASEAATEPPPVPEVAIDPSRSANDLVREAEALLRDGRALEAGPLLERAYELRPEDNHVVAGLAEVALARRDAPKAIEMAEAAVRLRSRRVSYRLLLGSAYELAGDAEHARQTYNQALRIEPGNGAIRQRLAALAEREGAE